MWYKTCGWSVRCIRNQAAGENHWDQINDLIHISPNPAADHLYINIGDQQDVEMKIYNMTGEMLLQKYLTHADDEIDISCLSKGLYLLRFFTSEASGNKKFIKE